MRFVDIDKVKKNLDENKPNWTAEDYAVACEDAEFYSTIEDFMAEHKEDIEMMMFAPVLVPDEPQWIPCSERMPEPLRDVIICTAIKTVTVAWINGNEWYFADTGNGHIEQWGFDDVTHWMPLPEPPEANAK